MTALASTRRGIAVLALGAWCCAGTPPAPADPAAASPAAAADERGMEERGPEPTAVDGPTVERLAVEELAVEVLATHPHDPHAFTQGLVFDGEHLLESTGQFGHSELRRVAAESGEVLARVALSADHFGEGLARIPAAAPGGEQRLIQLTWLAGKALVWSAERFEPRDGFTYAGEGWGLCFDGTSLVMSDGSAELTFRDPATFEPLRQVTVTLRGKPLHRLNELECVDGQVWANVLGALALVRIDPESGVVTAVADASHLLSAAEAASADVLNGIAWSPERKIFYVTGKYWPKLFEVRFVASEPGAPRSQRAEGL